MYALSRMYFINSFDFLSSCLSTHCLNNGTCSNSTGAYRCTCPPSFHGPFCQFDVNATNYSWNALEVALLFFVVFMIAFAIFIVCCASSNRMGFYISVPNKHYNRWVGARKNQKCFLGDVVRALLCKNSGETGDQNSLRIPMSLFFFFSRWAEEDDMFDDLPTENGEQLMAMANIRKGIVVSRTRETVLEELEDSAILQL
uniref:EGF-like domain-containing protein n=1 Tax=Caenorhabditis japonica TaxID=281687 RepID=A0A8R1HVB1_CAEJA